MRIPIGETPLPIANRPIRRGIGIAVLRMLGWRFAGAMPRIPQAVAVAAPHTSTWDVIVGVAVFWALDLRVAWMAKHTLFDWPLGVLMRSLGAVPIDRSEAGGAVAQMVTAFAERESMVLVLAPEGTRQKVTRWKSGFYRIAKAADVPVVVFGLDFGRKTLTLHDPYFLTDNMDNDIAILRSMLTGVIGKHPHRT